MSNKENRLSTGIQAMECLADLIILTEIEDPI